MRSAALFAAAALLSGSAYAAQMPADPAFTDITSKLQAAWNAGDGTAWGREFAPDAISIGIQGLVVHSAATIAARHARGYATVMKGTKLAVTLDEVRMLGPDAAILYMSQTVQRGPNDPAQAKGPIKVHVTNVVQKIDGQWLIVSAQNTEVAPERGAIPPDK